MDRDNDEQMENSVHDNIEDSGRELLNSLISLNENMLEKEQEIISIKLQLKTLVGNVNHQMAEFINSLAFSHENLHSRFLDVKLNNDELRKIKEYLLSCNLDSHKFSYKTILSKLGIKSIEEIFDINAIKGQNDLEKSVTASLILDHQKSEDIEEDKYFQSRDNFISSKRRSKPINIESFEDSKPKKESKNLKKLESFEDDSFNFNNMKDRSSGFNIPDNKEFDRKRAASNSLLESRPTANTANESKRFKEAEASTVDNSRNLTVPQTMNSGLNGLNPLQFMPNIAVDPEMICQMLIRKLAANGGLNNLNDLIRILPDNLLNRDRSNTE